MWELVEETGQNSETPFAMKMDPSSNSIPLHRRIHDEIEAIPVSCEDEVSRASDPFLRSTRTKQYGSFYAWGQAKMPIKAGQIIIHPKNLSVFMGVFLFACGSRTDLGVVSYAEVGDSGLGPDLSDSSGGPTLTSGSGSSEAGSQTGSKGASSDGGNLRETGSVDGSNGATNGGQQIGGGGVTDAAPCDGGFAGFGGFPGGGFFGGSSGGGFFGGSTGGGFFGGGGGASPCGGGFPGGGFGGLPGGFDASSGGGFFGGFPGGGFGGFPGGSSSSGG